MTLSENERQLVQMSFALVMEEADAVGLIFYERLFEVAPESQRLFKHDMATQANKLMQMLAVAVHALDTPDTLIPALVALAKRHVDYGVLPEHYDLVGSTLLWTLKAKLGGVFTSEIEAAWAATYTLIAEVMVKNADAN